MFKKLLIGALSTLVVIALGAGAYNAVTNAPDSSVQDVAAAQAAGQGNGANGAQTHATASVNGHPFVSFGASLLQHRAIGRRQATAEAGRRHEIQLVRESHQVQVRVRQRHSFGERTPTGESGLVAPVADVEIAFLTGGAVAAPHGERHGDAVARPPAADVPPHGFNLAGEFVTRHMG